MCSFNLFTLSDHSWWQRQPWEAPVKINIRSIHRLRRHQKATWQYSGDTLREPAPSSRRVHVPTKRAGRSAGEPVWKEGRNSSRWSVVITPCKCLPSKRRCCRIHCPIQKWFRPHSMTMMGCYHQIDRRPRLDNYHPMWAIKTPTNEIEIITFDDK